MEHPDARNLPPTLLVALLMALGAGPAPAQAPRDTGRDRWVATDALGRSLPGAAECGPPRPGKFVAIFYFLWIDGQVARSNGGLFDNSRLVADNPKAPAYGDVGAFHWWGEPRLGYYLNDDEFVIRKHAQMLADAGVDAIAFDVTNGPTYDHNFRTICRVFRQIRKEGGTTPQFFFLANAGSASVVQRLYDNVYAKNLHPDLWFRWKGKPLILAPAEGLSPELKTFFQVRQSWAWSDPNGWFKDGRDKWTWVDNHPQKPGWHDSPDRPEEVSVAVAQHATNNIGRSFRDGRQPPPDRLESGRGLCFAEQWRRALEVDPEIVFVTGWNEWIAQRFTNDGDTQFLGRPLAKGETFFVDQYSQEFSRDIEPMRGGHGDNYYYQLAANVRRFKGVRPRPEPTPPKSIRMEGGFEQWADVGPEFLDDLGDTAHRDHPGWGPAGSLTYRDGTGRNDIEAAKVARDGENVYFYVRCRSDITPAAGSNWMLLYIDADGDHRTGWEGYDYVVNRSIRDGKFGVVENHAGGRAWTAVTEARMSASGRELHLAIPRRAIGLAPGSGPIRLDFKWADDVPDSGDILDFLDKGDVAPNGRFNDRYEG